MFERFLNTPLQSIGVTVFAQIMTLPFTRFFISETFISNTRLKLTKNQSNPKQQAEVAILEFANYSHSLFTLSIKNNRAYSKI